MAMWTDSARRQYQRSGPRYASDLTGGEFALLEPMLPAAKSGGRRRRTDLREVLNAILYLVRTGCQWRMLPEGFPPCSTVYGYFRRFWQEGIWSRIWAFTASHFSRTAHHCSRCSSSMSHPPPDLT